MENKVIEELNQFSLLADRTGPTPEGEKVRKSIYKLMELILEEQIKEQFIKNSVLNSKELANF